MDMIPALVCLLFATYFSKYKIGYRDIIFILLNMWQLIANILTMLTILLSFIKFVELNELGLIPKPTLI